MLKPVSPIILLKPIPHAFDDKISILSQFVIAHVRIPNVVYVQIVGVFLLYNDDDQPRGKGASGYGDSIC